MGTNSKEYAKNWYKKNTQYRKDKAKLNKERIRNWYKEYKSLLFCELCGENHPACLDFHHRSDEEKIKDISLMVTHCYSIENILKEINKCTVLCSNCHRKLHWTAGSME